MSRVVFLAGCLFLLPLASFSGEQSCPKLLMASSEDQLEGILELYFEVLFEAGHDVVTFADFNRMLKTKDFYFLEATGSSLRDPISDALSRIRTALESRPDERRAFENSVESRLRSVLRKLRLGKKFAERGLGMPSIDWVRKFGRRDDRRRVIQAGVSANQNVFFELYQSAGSSSPYEVHGWRLSNGEELNPKQLKGFTATGFSVSPDRKYLALNGWPTLGYDQARIQLIELEDFGQSENRIAYRFLSHDPVWFSSDSAKLCQLSRRSSFESLDLKKLTMDYKLIGMARIDPTFKLAYAPPSGTNYVASSSHGSIYLSYFVVDALGALSPQAIGSELGDARSHRVFVFSKDAQTLLCHFVEEQAVSVWGVNPLKMRATVKGIGESQPVLSPNGRFLVAGRKVYSGEDGRELFDIDKDATSTMDFSTDGKLLAVALRRGGIVLYSLDRVVHPERHRLLAGRQVIGLHFSPDGASLAYAAFDQDSDSSSWNVLDLDFQEMGREI